MKITVAIKDFEEVSMSVDGFYSLYLVGNQI